MAKKPTDNPMTETTFKTWTETVFNKEIGEMKKTITNVARELLKNQEEFQEFKKTVATRDDVREVLKAVDSFAVNLGTYDKKAVVHDHRLNDHEKRLVTLENK